MEWVDSGERVEDLREIRAHVYLSGFIGNGVATDPCRIRDGEREMLLDHKPGRKRLPPCQRLRCHTTMIKRPKQSWSNLKGFCLYIKMVYDSCNKKSFLCRKSNKNKQVLHGLKLN